MRNCEYTAKTKCGAHGPGAAALIRTDPGNVRLHCSVWLEIKISALDRLWRTRPGRRNGDAHVRPVVDGHPGTIAPRTLDRWNCFSSQRRKPGLGSAHRNLAVFGPRLKTKQTELRGSSRRDRRVDTAGRLEAHAHRSTHARAARLTAPAILIHDLSFTTERTRIPGFSNIRHRRCRISIQRSTS